MLENVDEARITADEPKAIVRRAKPEMVTIGEGRNERQVCSTGRFNTPLGADYMLQHRDRWVPVGELARVFYGANTPINKQRIRRRMHDLFNHLLGFNAVVLVYEYDGTRIAAVKVCDRSSEYDRQAALPRLKQMAHRSQWTHEQYERVKGVLGVN